VNLLSTGLHNQLTKQIGEYLVACELARRGLIATTFSGNAPHFDLIVTDFKGSSLPIQVKTSTTGTWQFSIDKFVKIDIEGKKQIPGDKVPLQIPQLICVFVIAGENYGDDKFFVIEWSKFQDLLVADYTDYLKSHDFERPKKPDSMHCAIYESHLDGYRDNWSIIIHSFS